MVDSLQKSKPSIRWELLIARWRYLTKVLLILFRFILRFDVVRPWKHWSLGSQQPRSWLDLRNKSCKRLQPHQRSRVNSKSPSVSAVRFPILVPASKLSNYLVCPQLLLPMQQRGFDNESDIEDGKIILHFPVSSRERQIIALQKHTALLFVIVYPVCISFTISSNIILITWQLLYNKWTL